MNRLTPALTYLLAIIPKATPGHAAQLTEQALSLVQSDVPFSVSDRQSVVQAVEETMVGGLDKAGLPHAEAPAEMVAVTIAALVHPVNWWVACAWMSDRIGLQHMAQKVLDGQSTPARRVPTSQVFAMCVEAHGQDPALREKFQAELQKALTA